jgi:hypothetical protein
VDEMNRKVKKNMQEATPPFVGASGPMSAQSYAVLAMVAAGTRKIILPEITCLRKVAL